MSNPKHRALYFGFGKARSRSSREVVLPQSKDILSQLGSKKQERQEGIGMPTNPHSRLRQGCQERAKGFIGLSYKSKSSRKASSKARRQVLIRLVQELARQERDERLVLKARKLLIQTFQEVFSLTNDRRISCKQKSCHLIRRETGLNSVYRASRVVLFSQPVKSNRYVRKILSSRSEREMPVTEDTE